MSAWKKKMQNKLDIQESNPAVHVRSEEKVVISNPLDLLECLIINFPSNGMQGCIEKELASDGIPSLCKKFLSSSEDHHP